MKAIINRMLLFFAVTGLVTLLNIEMVSAQRPGRGGGFSGGRSRSGSFSSSRGSAFRTPSSRGLSPFRNSHGYAGNISRSGIRPGRLGYHRPAGYHIGGYYRSGWGFGRPYYRPYYSYYNFYRPFLGIRIGVLPYGYYPFYYGPNQFYYSEGLFYQQNNNQYEVVVPPVGAEVPSLPQDASPVTINGVDYYEYKGVYYTQKENTDGKTVYVVAGKDGVLNTPDGNVTAHQIGDVIDQLPEGCREVTIKNEKYFVSPDDVYFEEVVDGTQISYRVIGKLF